MFTEELAQEDPAIYQIIQQELQRQNNQIELIASENIVSRAVLEAQGSILTNKYAEGYSGKRYYGGCQFVDQVETLAIERICKIFNCKFANVQPHSGSTANQGVFMALLQPGDTILGMSLTAGGHLTHGCAANQSGKWFNAINYGVNAETGLLDYDEVRQLALEHHPKLIIAGMSAYSRIVDWQKFREIADEVGAKLMVDMAHIAGLIAADLYPSPFPFADVVTTTTHKTLRGPRGGVIMTNDEELAQKINSAIFPGIIGGPLMHVIAAKAVAFGEILTPAFKEYAKQVLKNARMLATTLSDRGIKIVTGGTDCHMLLVDLSELKTINGKQAEKALEKVNIACNKNTVPGEKRSPFITSGIRLGTPAGTTRGFKEDEFVTIGNIIADVLLGFDKTKDEAGELEELYRANREKVLDLCQRFPIYDYLH